jgi:predicted AAA+ superfamily ATPase
MHPDTVGHYIRALERLMVLEPLLAWHPVLRSKARVRTSAKHHFVDPAMTASLLRAGPEELSLDLKTFGLLFESLVLRDLRVYAGPLYASVRHFRDSSGREVDFVVESDSHQWAAFEVKLTGTHEVLEKAAAQLISFADTVDTQSSGKPVALGVIVAEGHAYTRPDGVHVIPLGALGP